MVLAVKLKSRLDAGWRMSFRYWARVVGNMKATGWELRGCGGVAEGWSDVGDAWRSWESMLVGGVVFTKREGGLYKYLSVVLLVVHCGTQLVMRAL